MAKFDLDKCIAEYSALYDKLPNDVKAKDDNKGPVKKPSKKNQLTPDAMRVHLTKLINETAKNTACTSCPQMGKCQRLNWKSDTTFVQVTGCSGHPDQVKFKGHSTTVVITDTAVSCYAQNNSGTSFAACRGAASASEGSNSDYLSSYTYYTAGTWVIGRGFLYFDTSVVPSGSTVTSAKHIFYCYNVFAAGSNTNMYIIKGTGAAPHSPVANADFDRTLYSGIVSTVAHSAINVTQYNDFTISDLTYIVVGGTTRGVIWAGDDYANNDPHVVGDDVIYGSGLSGRSAANPPKLSITYEAPVAPILRSLNKKQMVI